MEKNNIPNLLHAKTENGRKWGVFIVHSYEASMNGRYFHSNPNGN